jgi:hypothetical protein
MHLLVEVGIKAEGTMFIVVVKVFIEILEVTIRNYKVSRLEQCYVADHWRQLFAT